MGGRFALEPGFAEQAKAAGFDMAYLQFDGVTNEANSHRHISNLFDVKKIAIDYLHAAGRAFPRPPPAPPDVGSARVECVAPWLRRSGSWPGPAIRA